MHLPLQILLALLLAPTAPLRCEQELRRPGAAAFYTAAAARLGRWVLGGWDALPAWRLLMVGQVPPPVPANPASACVAVLWVLNAGVGVVLPTLALHMLEARSRRGLLARCL